MPLSTRAKRGRLSMTVVSLTRAVRERSRPGGRDRPAGSDARSNSLPPGIARHDRDRRLMERWLNAELDRVDSAAAQMRLAHAYWAKPEDEKRMMAMNPMWLLAHPEDKGDPVINAALSGDLEPLKQKYPDLARYDLLKLPKRGRGRRFKLNKLREATHNRGASRWDVTLAVWDAAIIRDLWKKNYTTKPKGYDSPEEIAARRRGVKASHVVEWKRSKSLPKNPYRR